MVNQRPDVEHLFAHIEEMTAMNEHVVHFLATVPR
jgi:hypothetical protein